MPYRLKRKESIAHGIRRVANEQFRAAEGELRTFRSPELVHSARKRLKMLRAVLRLVRPALDDATFDRENLALRDSGRLLSAQRDADVLDGAVAQFKVLADELGDDHDVQISPASSERSRPSRAPSASSSGLRDAIAGRRATLQKKARDSAKCLLGGEGPVFTKRFEATWASWRG